MIYQNGIWNSTAGCLQIPYHKYMLSHVLQIVHMKLNIVFVLNRNCAEHGQAKVHWTTLYANAGQSCVTPILYMAATPIAPFPHTTASPPLINTHIYQGVTKGEALPLSISFSYLIYAWYFSNIEILYSSTHISPLRTITYPIHNPPTAASQKGAPKEEY